MSESQVFTIGHSNQSLEDLIALLRRYSIAVLVDVRSQPYSKYAPHFDTAPLKAALAGAGIKYLLLGKELGGRPEGRENYDADGYVLYWRVARSPAFLAGLARLEKGIARYRVAVMCSEENPKECHRYLLISRVLTERGIAVQHIRGDGSLQTQEELAGSAQLMLPAFQVPEEIAWRSVHPVLQKEHWPDSPED